MNKDASVTRMELDLLFSEIRARLEWLEETYGRRDIGLYRYKTSDHVQTSWDFYRYRIRVRTGSSTVHGVTIEWIWRVKFVFSDPKMAVHMKLTW
jgi:hypothetical protein